MSKPWWSNLKNNENGFTTMTAMVVIFSLLSGVLLSYGFISALINRNELYRREIVLSKNILLSYDTYLFDHFGLLAYDSRTIQLDALIAAQFEEPKFSKAHHEWQPVTTLNVSSALLTQITNVVSIRLAEGALTELGGYKAVLEKSVLPYSDDFSKWLANKGEFSQVLANEDGNGTTGKKTTGKKSPGKKPTNKVLEDYKNKIQRMKDLSKENGLQQDGETSGDSTGSKNKLVQNLKPVKFKADRKVTVTEKAALILFITGVFSDRVESKERELSFYPENKRSTPLPKGETEYVLVGSNNNDWNRKIVSGEIFALRVATQMKAVVEDRVLMLRLNQEACAIAAILPILPQSAIVMSLVAAEAAERSHKDLKKLLNGEGVALIENMPSVVYYDDYLRLLLIMQSDAKLIERSLAIIGASYEQDTNRVMNFDRMTVRHRIMAIQNGKTVTQIEDGFTESNEQGVLWLTNGP